MTEIKVNNWFINALTSSSVAFGVIAATTMLGSTPAQAFLINLSEAETCTREGMECMEGDKFIYDISFTGDLDLDTYGDATIELEQNPNEPLNYEVVMDFLTNDPPFFTGNGEFHYTIEATDGLFVATGVDSDVFGTIANGSTVIEKSSESFTTVVSIDGLTDFTNISPPQESLKIIDTLSTVSPGSINEFSNEFLQTTPEPATILGILAFGGLSLGLKRKK